MDSYALLRQMERKRLARKTAEREALRQVRDRLSDGERVVLVERLTRRLFQEAEERARRNGSY